MEVLYLSRAGVEAVGLPMAEVIEALEAMFREKGEGRVEMPPKPGDSYFQGSALREADRLVTDDVAQMDYYRGIGYFRDTPPIDVELGDILCGRRPGRGAAHERAIALNLGIALDDMATAIRVYERALERGLGTRLPL